MNKITLAVLALLTGFALISCDNAPPLPGPLAPDSWTVISASPVSYDPVIGFGNNTFVIWDREEEPPYYSTDNGKTWTQAVSNNADIYEIWGIAFSGSVLIAYGYGDIAVSSDGGKNWTGITNPFDEEISSIAANGNNWVAVANRSVEIKYSTDGGQSWSMASNPNIKDEDKNEIINSFAYGNGVFVAGCNDGIILYSTDNGENWSLGTDTDDVLGSWYDVYSVLWTGSAFFAMGNRHLLSSTEGINWYEVDTGSVSFDFLWQMSYGNGYLVVIVYFEFDDGDDWRDEIWYLDINSTTWNITDYSVSSPDYTNSITFGNNTFVVVNAKGNIAWAQALSP